MLSFVSYHSASSGGQRNTPTRSAGVLETLTERSYACPAPPLRWPAVRLIVARCEVSYSGHERARSNVVELSDVATLRGLREEATTAERCDLLAARFDCFALYRDPVELVAYSTGNAPGGLPRNGFKAAPGLVRSRNESCVHQCLGEPPSRHSGDIGRQLGRPSSMSNTMSTQYSAQDS